MKWLLVFALLPIFTMNSYGLEHTEASDESIDVKKLVYLVSDRRIPFWNIMWRGIRARADELGYDATIYSAENIAKRELHLAVQAIRDHSVIGIIVSPTNSSACVTILKLARSANIPVVIADIGTERGDYVSYISSDNRAGAYELGKILASTMKSKNWQDGTVGIIAIPQRRENGQARTAGFMRALNEAGIRGAGIQQQVNFTYQETYDFANIFIRENPDLHALWLQGSNRYQGALDAIKDNGREDEILLLTFDAEPEFLEMIPQGTLLAVGMQQPFLIGSNSVDAMHAYLQGKPLKKEQKLPVLAVWKENIEQLLPVIRRNVLGMIQSSDSTVNSNGSSH